MKSRVPVLFPSCWKIDLFFVFVSSSLMKGLTVERTKFPSDTVERRLMNLIAAVVHIEQDPRKVQIFVADLDLGDQVFHQVKVVKAESGARRKRNHTMMP